MPTVKQTGGISVFIPVFLIAALYNQSGKVSSAMNQYIKSFHNPIIQFVFCVIPLCGFLKAGKQMYFADCNGQQTSL